MGLKETHLLLSSQHPVQQASAGSTRAFRPLTDTDGRPFDECQLIDELPDQNEVLLNNRVGGCVKKSSYRRQIRKEMSSHTLQCISRVGMIDAAFVH